MGNGASLDSLVLFTYLQMYDGAYHQVHNESDGVGDGAIRELADWISNRI